ncbi:hypothetical protein ACFP63_14265 [Oerskovia jenensis]|uniref:Malto-oligosyltrehalose trehalohydrolase n=1 Tax=Oerskovia jenensis TaxID=162169 RepID=A0ABS2L9W4_9CELL|nr:hypothetical protein [Oerskovia jenensis]MBM7477216.1 hypothetical protein [Oerskovia jenensis]
MTSRYRNITKPPDPPPTLVVPGPRPVVWAPQARTLEVVLPRAPGVTPDDHVPAGTRTERRPLRLVGMDLPGWWSADDDLAPGTDYAFSVDGGRPLPDPRSPRQPHGLLGWSRSFDPTFAWTDGSWAGPPAQGAVLEIDVGTFTPEGTLDAAAHRFDELVDLGVAVVELHTIGSVAGVVCPHLYTVCEEFGGPRALQRFVDAAHSRGLGVSLGVAYHRAAPAAAFLQSYAPYLSPQRTRLRPVLTGYLSGGPLPDEPVPQPPAELPSGRRVNLDRAGSREVHDWITSSARRWFDDFHVDALRIARVQDLADASPVHVLVEVARTADAATTTHRRPVRLVGECDTRDPRLLVPAEQGGRGLSQVWVHEVEDAFHELLDRSRETDPAWFGSLSRLLTAPDAERTMIGLSPPVCSAGDRGDPESADDDDAHALAAALALASAFVPRLVLPVSERLLAWWSTLLTVRRSVPHDTPRLVHRGPSGVVLVQRGRLVTAVNIGSQPRTTLLPTSRRAWHVTAQWPPLDVGSGRPARSDAAQSPPSATPSGSSVRVGARSAVVLTSR